MRPRGLVAVIGAIAAGLVLASAGAGVAMKLDRGEPTGSVIRAVSVDQARIDKAIATARSKLRAAKLLRLLNAGNRPALLLFLKKNYGMNPKKLVIQNGAKNYAGPNCPGTGWNCTRARQVIQYSLHHDDDDDPDFNGPNRFVCSNSYGGTPSPPDRTAPTISCQVIQMRGAQGGNNAAACIQQTNNSRTPVQVCRITQFTPKGHNAALIDQEVSRRDTGSTEQEVLQQAFLDQSAVNGSNLASIDQDANLLIVGSSLLGQEQDAHQLADATLETVTGHNGLNVDQHQDLEERSTGAAVRQLQNTDRNSVVDCELGTEPDAPNSCADIDMTTNTGNNLLDLDQENDLDMTAAGTAGFQQQGSCESAIDTDPPGAVTTCVAGNTPDGGTEASINMFSFEEGATNGTPTGRVLQEMPTNKPSSLTQLQFADPGCCFGTFFVGDPANATINLLANQSASASAYQTADNILGCISGNPDGGSAQCSATMTVTNNDGTSTNSASGQALFGAQSCDNTGTSACPAPVITTTTETFPTTAPPPTILGG